MGKAKREAPIITKRPYAGTSRWSRLLKVSTLQRSIQIWSFAFMFTIKYLLISKKFTYGRKVRTALATFLPISSHEVFVKVQCFVIYRLLHISTPCRRPFGRLPLPLEGLEVLSSNHPGNQEVEKNKVEQIRSLLLLVTLCCLGHDTRTSF